MVEMPATTDDSYEADNIARSQAILPDLSFIFVNGHTDAMMLPVIEYKGKTIIYVADLFPSLAHIPLPYVMAYDMFPLTTLHEKKMILSWALKNDGVLFFEHDPLIECCSLQLTEKGIRSNAIFKISEL
jgi:glyoxylase-like metal-dependent hydrolase (beta-lactamase superfamily II)